MKTDNVDGCADDGPRLLFRVSAVGVVRLRHRQNRVVNEQLAAIRLADADADADAGRAAGGAADAAVGAVGR